MGKKGKPWRVREPNLLIEAKQKMTREELLVWAWCLANARFWITDGDGRELTLEELEEIRKKQEVFYAVSSVELEELRRRFPEHFSPRKVKYWREVLKGMEKKIVFEVNCETYKQVLEDLGFTYILEKFVKKKDPTYCGIATIIGVFYSEPKGDLQVVYTPLVAPLLVLLKKWFTIYNFEEVLKLDLKASIVLYRIFKEKLGLKRNEFELSKEDLLELLDLKKISGKDLRRDYIDPAVKEINEKTRLKVEVEQIRRGRGRGGKIVGFRFRVEEEPRPEEATTKDLVENFDVLKKWFKKTIEQLAEELFIHRQVSPAEIAQSLLSLERINPAIAIWFLLHYPKSEAKLYAWEHIKWVEDHPKLDLPNRYLQHTIRVPKKELDFLQDQRVKHAALSILEELKKEWEEKQESKKPEPKKAESEPEEIEIRNPVVGILAEEILSEAKYLSEEEKQKLKQELGVESFRDYLRELIRSEDITNLQKMRVMLEKVKQEYEKKTMEKEIDPFDSNIFT